MANLEIKPIYSEQDAVAVLKQMAELSVLVENAKEEIEERQKAIKAVEAQMKLVEDELVKYYKDEIEMDDEFDFNCEYGEFKSRTATSWKYDDEKKILAYLKANNPKLVRTKEEIDKNALKKAYEVVEGRLYDEDNDEFIEGVRVAKETTYKITLNTKAVV